MAHKETIALIGATTTTGQQLVPSLLALPCLLLLMDGSTESLHALYDTLPAGNNLATVDLLSCSREASWEADIILIAGNEANLEAIAAKIEEVATGKLILFITTDESNRNSLQQWLPFSPVVTVLARNEGEANAPFSIAIMESNARDTLQKADAFFKRLGVAETGIEPTVSI